MSAEVKNLPVDVVHAESLDAMLTENLLLANINRSKTNVDQLLDAQAHVILEPAKVLLVILLSKTSQESNRHAVNVSAVTALRSVDVRMRINPDNSNLTVQPLPSSLGSTSNSTNRNAVVTTECEGHAALARVLVCVRCDLAGHGGCVTGLLHAAVVRVRLGHEVLELLDGLVAKELVAELVADLGQEAGLNEGGGTDVDAGLGLATGETDGDDADFIGLGEEAAVDETGVHDGRNVGGDVEVEM